MWGAAGAWSALALECLRWRCPCALCAGGMGRPRQLQFTTELKPEQYTLVTIDQVGHYAIRPTWADGHDSGMYAFATD